MAQPRKADQIRRLLTGLDAGGATVLAVSKSSSRPVDLEVLLTDGQILRFVLYCWNVTLGGGRRSRSERRVQMTSVPQPLYPAAGRPPLLLGYHEDTDTFAAWDASKHRETRDPSAAGESNSLYVPLSILQEARKLGFASHEHVVASTEHEVVVAFRPEVADNYLRIAGSLRPAGAANVAATASAASGGAIPRAGLSQKRRTVLRTVRQVVRDARFPSAVLSAYGEKCAFCDLGAKLVDAAHIKSVKVGGPDHVTNGVGACPTHHRAFDRGFLLIQDSYVITVNRKGTGFLSRTDEAMLKRNLRPKLALPSDVTLRPDLRFIRTHRRQFG